MLPEHVRNALLDRSTEFAIVPSIKLKQLIVQNEHPAIVELPSGHKEAMLLCQPGKCIPIGRDLVIRYINKQCTINEKFILDLCDVRFWPTRKILCDKPRNEIPQNELNNQNSSS